MSLGRAGQQQEPRPSRNMPGDAERRERREYPFGPSKAIMPCPTASELEAMALERCVGKGHTRRKRGREEIACARCMQAVLLGEREAHTVEALPLSVTGLARTLFGVLCEDFAEFDLRDLTAKMNQGRDGLPPYTETNVSARLRDLRQLGYRIVRKVQDGKTAYRLDPDA